MKFSNIHLASESGFLPEIFSGGGGRGKSIGMLIFSIVFILILLGLGANSRGQIA